MKATYFDESLKKMPFELPDLPFSIPYAWGAAGVGAFVSARLIGRLIFGKSSGGSSGFAGPAAAAAASASSSAAAEEEAAASAAAEAEREQAEYEQAMQQAREQTEQEIVNELFELVDDGRETDEQREEREKEEEKEAELGKEREEIRGLRETYAALIAQITELSAKGLSCADMTRTIALNDASRMPADELNRVIGAMSAFLDGQTEKSAHAAVNADHERRAALSALKRGDYEEAFDYLDRRADAAESKMKGTRRGDIRAEARGEAVFFRHALAVLSRPVDVERSFDALQKADELEPENPTTEMMIGQLMAETGNHKGAEQYYGAAASRGGEEAEIAAERLSDLRFGRVALEAARIGRDYAERFADDTVRTDTRAKTARRENARVFDLDEWRERQNVME